MKNWCILMRSSSIDNRSKVLCSFLLLLQLFPLILQGLFSLFHPVRMIVSSLSSSSFAQVFMEETDMPVIVLVKSVLIPEDLVRQIPEFWILKVLPLVIVKL